MRPGSEERQTMEQLPSALSADLRRLAGVARADNVDQTRTTLAAFPTGREHSVTVDLVRQGISTPHVEITRIHGDARRTIPIWARLLPDLAEAIAAALEMIINQGAQE